MVCSLSTDVDRRWSKLLVMRIGITSGSCGRTPSRSVGAISRPSPVLPFERNIIGENMFDELIACARFSVTIDSRADESLTTMLMMGTTTTLKMIRFILIR